MKLKTYLIKLIDFYQKNISPFQKFFHYSGCIFYPTCSDYAKQAIEKYGVFKGLYLSFLRIIRCNPWVKNHFDPLL